MANHDCLCFWGQWANLDDPANFFDIIDHIARGDVLRMSKPTYDTIVALQRAIERAVGDPEAPVLVWVGGGVPSFPEGDEALMCAVANQIIAGLGADEADVSPGCHDPIFVSSPPGWLMTGSRQMAPSDVRNVLKFDGLGGGGDPTLGTDLLGRVRNT